MNEEAEVWRILLEGGWGADWGEGIEGARMDRLSDGTTRITGRFPDQAALAGYLARIIGLGGRLVSLKKGSQGAEEDC